MQFGNEIPWVVYGKKESFETSNKILPLPKIISRHLTLCSIRQKLKCCCRRKAELVQTAKQVALKSLKFVHPNTEGVLQMVASSNLALKQALPSLEEEFINS